MEIKYLLVYRLISTAAALLFLIIFFLMIEEDVISPDWKKYQRDYIDVVGENGLEINTHKLSSIRQIEIKPINRVDRCITCHLNMGQSGFDSLEIPYASHPGSFLEEHDLSEYSCTFCHNGDGRSLRRHETCAEENHIDRKPLDSHCIGCHLAVFDLSQVNPSMPNVTR